LAGHPYRHKTGSPPEALALQLLDDEAVLRRLPAPGAEEAPVRVPDGVRSLPAAEAADAVRVARAQK